jgi:hypothetical protein
MRIKYQASNIPNVRQSAKVFMADDGKQYRIFINDADTKFYIRDEISGDLVQEGQAASYQMLVRAIRKAMKDLKVPIKVEPRKENRKAKGQS